MNEITSDEYVAQGQGLEEVPAAVRYFFLQRASGAGGTSGCPTARLELPPCQSSILTHVSCPAKHMRSSAGPEPVSVL